MKKSLRFLALGLTAAMTAGLAGCGTASQTPQTSTSSIVSDTSAIESTTATDTQTEIHKIGVAIYNPEDDEVQMFRSYYEDYLTAAFNVDFIYSDAIRTADDEKNFAKQAKDAGCEGIISYVSYNLPEIAAFCDEEDLYYTIGSGTFTDDEFTQASQYQKFLGITGPSADDEYNAGKDLISTLADNGDIAATAKSWLLCDGGAAEGNYMHEQRFLGALESLQDLGYTLTASADELKTTTENGVIATHPDGGSVYLCAGYYARTENRQTLTSALAAVDPDAVVSVCSLANVYDDLRAKETTQGKNIQVGAVDAFTDANREAFEAKDDYGNSLLNCIVGKCRAMSAPAFIAMYNAVTGHENIVKDNGAAYHLSQSMWIATTPEEYEEMSAKASNIYQNIYSTNEMMQVLGTFHPAATYADFSAFVSKL